MVNQPLVSVGIPTYNRPSGLRRALECMTSQTYQNLEIIISDNASPDPEVEQVAREFAQGDKRIKYHKQDENIGAFLNFQFLPHQATGKYFMWAADDDFWMPEFINKMVAQLERNEESGVAMSAVRRMRDNKTEFDVVRFSGKLDPSRMSPFQLSMAIASGKKLNLFIYGLYRTAFLKSAIIRFPQVVAADRLFICQVALATKFSYVDEVLHVRRMKTEPMSKRYQGDPLGKEYNNFFRTERTLFALGPYLCSSKIIPFHRKLYIPILIFRYFLLDLSYGKRLRRLVVSYISKFIKKNKNNL